MAAAYAFNPTDLISAVATKGLLAHHSGTTPVTFSFVYCGFRFSVAAVPTSDAKTAISVVSDLGMLPFTAEGQERRRMTIKILQGVAGRMGGRLKLGADQHVTFNESFVLDEVLTPNVLITHMVKILLNARPYLDLFLSEVGPLRGAAVHVPEGAVSSSPAA